MQRILSFCTSTLSWILQSQTICDLFSCRVLRSVWCLETPILYSVPVSHKRNVKQHILTKRCCTWWSFVYCIGKVAVKIAHVTSVRTFGTGYYCVNHVWLSSTNCHQCHEYLMHQDNKTKTILPQFNNSVTSMCPHWFVLDHQGFDSQRYHFFLGSA